MEPWERLREERERLRLTQSAFGAIGGVKKVAQINYEKGTRSPDSRYLSALAAKGVDVEYILTGTRRGPAATDALPLAAPIDIELYGRVVEAVVLRLAELDARLSPRKKSALLHAAYAAAVLSGYVNSAAIDLLIRLAIETGPVGGEPRSK